MRRLRKLARKGRWFQETAPHLPEPPPSERPSRLRRLLQWVALGLRLLYYTLKTGVGLNPAIGAAAGYVFNLNSLHDPNTSGVGHQPTGFDQLIAIYEQFVVYGVKYRIQVANSETSLEAIHGITITDQPGTVTDPRQYMENGQTQWKCVAARGGGNISEFSGYVDLAKVHGIKPEEYLEEDVYAGNSATSPTEMHICMFGLHQ